MIGFRDLFKSKAGFTLIELLVVIAVISILAAIAVPRLTGVTDKARKAEAVNALGAFKTALEMYEVENGGYPDANDSGDYTDDQDAFNAMADEYIDGYTVNSDNTGDWNGWTVTYAENDGGPEFSVTVTNEDGLKVVMTHTATGGFTID